MSAPAATAPDEAMLRASRRDMRVLVTRPAPEANEWVVQLKSHGFFSALALPLIEIAPVAPNPELQAAWREMTQLRAVMCVSAAAARHFLAARPADCKLDATRLPRFWAPGPGTARALRVAGVPAARIASPPKNAQQFDSEALWAEVGGSVQPGDRVLIVRGEDATEATGSPASATGHGRDWMAQTLAQRGADVRFVVAYQRRTPAWGAAERSAAQRPACGATWLFSNSGAIASLLRLVPPPQVLPAAAVCTHSRIAAAARAAGFEPVAQARPDVGSIVLALDALAPKPG